jgi:hypothetical protein
MRVHDGVTGPTYEDLPRGSFEGHTADLFGERHGIERSSSLRIRAFLHSYASDAALDRFVNSLFALVYPASSAASLDQSSAHQFE